MSLLEIQNITVQFGAIKAVDDVSFRLAKGKILGLIGPNGSGKTTLLNSLSGFTPLHSGTILFADINISSMPPEARAQIGMGRSFQREQLFEEMSVLENVLIAAYCHYYKQSEAKNWAMHCLEKVGLINRVKEKAANLNLADRKRLGLAKALAVKPRLLLLDEVMAGLNPESLADMIELVLSLTLDGTAIILIEHIMQAIVTLADNVIVLSQGKMIAEGTPDYITENPIVLEAYLGQLSSSDQTNLNHA